MGTEMPIYICTYEGPYMYSTCILHWSWDADPIIVMNGTKNSLFCGSSESSTTNPRKQKENLSDSPTPAIEKFCLDLFISRDRSMAEGTATGQLTTSISRLGYYNHAHVTVK